MEGKAIVILRMYLDENLLQARRRAVTRISKQQSSSPKEGKNVVCIANHSMCTFVREGKAQKLSRGFDWEGASDEDVQEWFAYVT